MHTFMHNCMYTSNRMNDENNANEQWKQGPYCPRTMTCLECLKFPGITWNFKMLGFVKNR